MMNQLRVWVSCSIPLFCCLIQTKTPILDLSQMSSDELKDTQTIMEEKVYRIWTVLSAFEG